MSPVPAEPPLLLPRLAAERLLHALDAMPVVVLTGARQTGKSTVVRDLLGDPERRYVSLDSRAVLERALSDPEAFVAQAGTDGTITIDEVQRAPALLNAIKLAVDEQRQRRAGRFILTGSANLLLMRQVSESLAGRAAYITIAPMTRREQLGFGRAGIWGDLIESPVARWRDLALAQAAPFEDWRELALRGGYPRPAVHLSTEALRSEWFSGYVDTYLERDLPDISPIAHRADFRRLMQALAVRTGTLVNQTQLARETALPQTTVQRYLNLLEVSYQLVRIPAYTASRAKRLIKTPKLFWGDPGLARHLAGERQPRGAHLENVVALDLLAWRHAHSARTNVLYWRTTTGREVDFVIETGQQLIPIEVKATTQPSTGDLANLRAFMDEYQSSVPGGLLLHCGTEVFWIAERVLAVPWWHII